MGTRARHHPHPLECYACRKVIPAGEPIHIQVGFYERPPMDPKEEARRKAYEQALSDKERASLSKLRAVFAAMGSRRGWTYGVFCHVCKEASFQQGLEEDGTVSAWKQGISETHRSRTFQEHLDVEYRQRPCRGCGRPIYWKTGYSMPRAYCGDGCRTIYKRRVRQAEAPGRQHTMTCAECGETFRARRDDARYCSPRCRQRAKRTKSRHA